MASLCLVSPSCVALLPSQLGQEVCSVQLRACLAGHGSGLATVPVEARFWVWSLPGFSDMGSTFTGTFGDPSLCMEFGSHDATEASEFVEEELQVSQWASQAELSFT